MRDKIPGRCFLFLNFHNVTTSIYHHSAAATAATAIEASPCEFLACVFVFVLVHSGKKDRRVKALRLGACLVVF
jgi:hypothetical protein